LALVLDGSDSTVLSPVNVVGGLGHGASAESRSAGVDLLDVLHQALLELLGSQISKRVDSEDILSTNGAVSSVLCINADEGGLENLESVLELLNGVVMLLVLDDEFVELHEGIISQCKGDESKENELHP